MIQSDRGNPDHQKARHSRTELARSQKLEGKLSGLKEMWNKQKIRIHVVEKAIYRMK